MEDCSDYGSPMSAASTSSIENSPYVWGTRVLVSGNARVPRQGVLTPQQQKVMARRPFQSINAIQMTHPTPPKPHRQTPARPVRPVQMQLERLPSAAIESSSSGTRPEAPGALMCQQFKLLADKTSSHLGLAGTSCEYPAPLRRAFSPFTFTKNLELGLRVAAYAASILEAGQGFVGAPALWLAWGAARGVNLLKHTCAVLRGDEKVLSMRSLDVLAAGGEDALRGWHSLVAFGARGVLCRLWLVRSMLGAVLSLVSLCRLYMAHGASDTVKKDLLRHQACEALGFAADAGLALQPAATNGQQKRIVLGLSSALLALYTPRPSQQATVAAASGQVAAVEAA